MNEFIDDAVDRMEKSLKLLKDQLVVLGFGGISGAIDNIKVEYYGSQTPLIQLAVITSPYRGKFIVRPHDPTTAKDIERAIHKANLGVSVMSEKTSVIVTAPAPNIQQREKLADHATHLGNDAKVAVRKIRQDVRTKLKKAKLPEDDEKRTDRELQDYTDDYCNQVDQLVAKRRALIMEG